MGDLPGELDWLKSRSRLTLTDELGLAAWAPAAPHTGVPQILGFGVHRWHRAAAAGRRAAAWSLRGAAAPGHRSTGRSFPVACPRCGAPPLVIHTRTGFQGRLCPPLDRSSSGDGRLGAQFHSAVSRLPPRACEAECIPGHMAACETCVRRLHRPFPGLAGAWRQVLVFANERAMLEAWRTWLLEADPDILNIFQVQHACSSPDRAVKHHLPGSQQLAECLQHKACRCLCHPFGFPCHGAPHILGAAW